MSAINFAPEKETQVKTVTEVRELLATDYALEPHTANILDLSISVDTKKAPQWCLSHPQVGESLMTLRSFRALLSRLGIPPKFALAIPEDLVEVIVRRLREVKPQAVKLFTKENVVYNLTPDDYHEPNLDGILEFLSERSLEQVRVGTDGFRLDYINDLTPVEVQKNDIIKSGIYIRACDSGRPIPLARLMTYRLVCLNGAVMGQGWGEVKWPRKNGESLQTFLNGMTELMSREELLTGLLQELPNRKMTDFEFSHLWKSTKKVVGVESADRLLDVDKENRRAIITSVAVKHKEHGEPAALADFSAYDRFNSLSSFANDLPGAEAERVQRVAGMLLRAPEVN